jgi:hypothetical protein
MRWIARVAITLSAIDFKRLTTENWAERDRVNEHFHHVDPHAGTAAPMSGDDWAREFLKVELDPRVPEEIRDLFAIARGTMLYGHFFYPLYQAGSEQLYRVADAAAGRRYKDLGGPPDKDGRLPRFASRTTWLRDHGAISDRDAAQWEAVRQLRNIASHPERASVFTPGNALSSLVTTRHIIDALFGPPVLRRRSP